MTDNRTTREILDDIDASDAAEFSAMQDSDLESLFAEIGFDPATLAETRNGIWSE